MLRERKTSKQREYEIVLLKEPVPNIFTYIRKSPVLIYKIGDLVMV